MPVPVPMPMPMPTMSVPMYTDMAMVARSDRSDRSDATVVDVQQLLMDHAEDRSPEPFARALRDSLLEAMVSGKVLVLRLNQSAPDLALTYNLPAILPFQLWRHEFLKPGPLHEDLHPMLSEGAYKGKEASFSIANGFHLVVTSAFSMHTFRANLRGKLPIGNFQPVQVCSSLSQVAAVLRDPRKACPETSVDDAMAAMDALADML